MIDVNDTNSDAESIADELKQKVKQLQAMGRNDLLLSAIGVSTLEMLRIEAARAKLSRLQITKDYRFLLLDYNKEVVMSPIHKAVYILFLRHPEGIEFKQLADYHDELLHIYESIANRMDYSKIQETVDRLTNPMDNAINEKCSRIKAIFLELMDIYSASYYFVGSHAIHPITGSNRIWFKRLKIISLPRELVVWG